MPSSRAKLLIVDDEFNTREALIRFLGKKFDVTGAENGSAAIEQLQHNDFDLVLTDLRMPEADGMSVLDAAMSKAKRPQCILLTAYGSISDAVTAMKKGAFDFVTKPVKLARLESVIDAALKAAAATPANGGAENSTGEKTPASAPAALPVKHDRNVLLPQSENDPMRKVLNTALTIAPAKSTVLLTGESGTGKEVVARYIHDNSGRKGLFVPVHCAALSATLLESELFGYEKGAFTGAAERRRGRFELADGGTIFLDEIGEIDHATQVKLLRVLETRSFERVGGTETIHCDIRLIAATNRDLRAMTAAGTFREDLFYRLSVINLDLPPLRERKEEIPLLVKNFVSEFAADNNKPAPEIPQEVINELMSRRWQGNIRELRNCIECMVALNTSGRLEISDIPEIHRKVDASPAVEPPANPLNLENSERELILKALKETNGNRAAAARMLGISRRTLYRKLEKEGLEEE